MIIFDLDLTLVNSQPTEALRAARNWSAVVARIPDLQVYDGITELLIELRAQCQKLAIVTKNPSKVPHAFIRHHKWPIDTVIGYHQVRRQKPSPEGILLAMQSANATERDTFHIGDSPEDTEAAKSADVVAIGAGWGLSDTSLLEESSPDQLFLSVRELREFLLKHIKTQALDV